MIKKILIVLILSLTISIFTIKERKIINADEVKTVTALGAQIRTEKIDEKYGIRFSFKTQNIDISEVDYFVTLITRYVDKDDLTIENGLDEENDKVISIIADSFFEENIFVGSLVKIPGEKGERDFNPIEDELIARGVVVLKNGTKIYSDEITRNVVDVARNEYNNNLEPCDVVNELVKDGNRLIKITSTSIVDDNDVIIRYVGTIPNMIASLSDEYNDVVEICANSFNVSSAKFTIDKSHVELLGANHDIKFDEDGNRIDPSTTKETSNSYSIILADGVEDIEINGLKLTGSYGVQFAEGTISNVTISNCLIDHTSYYGIRISSGASTGEYSNIIIKDNYITSSREEYIKTIYLTQVVNNISIIDNYLISEKTDRTLLAAEGGIYLDKIADDSFVEIKGNKFSYYRANYLINVGGEMTEASYSAYINIEDNKLGPSDSFILGGNGIRISGIKSGSSVSVLHNYDCNFNPYFNTLVIKAQGSDNSIKTLSGTVEAKININYNIFKGAQYTNETVIANKPDGRNDISSNFQRIGLGVSPTSNVESLSNYYNRTLSTSVYSTNSTATGASSAYTNLSNLIKNNKAASAASASAEYTSYLSTYNSNISTITNENSYEGSYAPYIIYCIKNNIPFTPNGFTA